MAPTRYFAIVWSQTWCVCVPGCCRRLVAGRLGAILPVLGLRIAQVWAAMPREVVVHDFFPLAFISDKSTNAFTQS